VEAAARAATGFLYVVSVAGVTGARAELPAGLAEKVAAVRKKSPVPVVIGFGVSGPEQAEALGALADGVVVGSAIVTRIAQGGSLAARAARVQAFVASLAKGLRARR
jgi:tryptophan synthase alpha chain